MDVSIRGNSSHMIGTVVTAAEAQSANSAANAFPFLWFDGNFPELGSRHSRRATAGHSLNLNREQSLRCLTTLQASALSAPEACVCALCPPCR